MSRLLVLPQALCPASWCILSRELLHIIVYLDTGCDQSVNLPFDGQIVVLGVETQGWNLMSDYHPDKYDIAQRVEVTYL